MEYPPSDVKWSQFLSPLMRQGPAIRKACMGSLVELLCSDGAPEINILEIGSWAGASTIAWALAIRSSGRRGTVHCVDFWRPYFDLTINDDAIYAEMDNAARSGSIFDTFKQNIANAGLSDLVSYTIGDAKDVLPCLTANSYQIVFVDGSHQYEAVLRDILQARRLVTDGGIVCGDDLELLLSEVDPAAHERALKTGVDFIADPLTEVRYHPGVSQAVADAFGAVSVRDGLWAMRKRAGLWDQVDLSALVLEIPEHLGQIEEPSIVSTQYGFNIVRLGKRHIACRQAAGPIDFALPEAELVKRYSRDDLIFEGSYLEALVQVYAQEIKRLTSLLGETGVAQ